MLLHEIAPFVRNALNNSLHPQLLKDIYTPLRAQDHRLYFMQSGEGCLIIENESFELQPQTLILLPAGTTYVWQPKTTLRFLTLNFDFTAAFSHIKKSFHPCQAQNFPGPIESIFLTDASCLCKPLVLPRMGLLEHRIREIILSFCSHSPYKETLLCTLMKSVLISIVEAKSTKQDTDTQRSWLVYELLQYLQEHYQEEINSTILSQQFHFSITYLNRHFREKTGSSLHRFLMEHRIKMAMELLATDPRNVSEIARAVGFSDIYHFTKTFKRLTGQTPLAYRYENSISVRA